MKKKKMSFAKGYLIFVAVLVCLIGAGLGYLWSFLEDYENSLPKYEMERNLQMFTDGDFGQIIELANVEFSKYETKETLINYFSTMSQGKTFTYEKKGGAYTNDTPVYVVLLDGEPFATVALKPQAEKTKNNLTQWELDYISDIGVAGKKVDITVPSDAAVTVNGIVVESDAVVESDIEIHALSKLPDTVSKPTMVKYEITDLINDPQVIVTGTLGNELAMTKDSTMENMTFEFTGTDEYFEQFSQQAMDIATIYTKYLANDVGFRQLAQYVDSDAEIYDFLRTMEVIWFTEHTSYKFENMEASNILVYSSDCISIDVTYDYYVYRSEKEYHYPSDITLYFINKNGKFIVGDLEINSVE